MLNKPNNIEDIGAEPDMPALLFELKQSLTDSAGYLQQCARDYNTRYCLWDGQNHDGRKWKRSTGKDPFPFDGASDSRIRTADEIINEQVKIMMAAWRRSTIQCSAINSDNIAGGQKVTYLLQWLFKNHLKQQLDAEVELLANWRQTHGMAVLGVFWEQERRLEMEQLDAFVLRDAAVASAQQGDPAGLQMMARIMDPLQENSLVEMIRGMSPLIDGQRARKILRDIRTLRTAEIPKVYVIKSLPRWVALRPYVDVFWQMNARSLQRSRWVASSEWLSETELNDRIETEAWDADFVSKAVEQKGKAAIGGADGFLTDWTLRRQRSVFGTGSEDFRNLVQIFHFYYKGLDRRTGTPAMYCTIGCPAVKDAYAKHDLAAYQHGKYPFVESVRERIDFAMTESRGVADIAAPAQAEIKAQRDARTDVTSLTTMPPVLVPMSRAKTKLAFGPGTQHGTRRPGEIQWMNPPVNDGRSVEIEAASQAGVDRYFGRYSATVPPVIAQLFAQDLADKFLGELAQAGQMTVQLSQQYLEDTTVQRVVGNIAQPFHVGRDEIQGQYDLLLTFDASLLDMEYVIKKLDAFNKLIMPADTLGVIDRAGYIQIAASWLDPNLADRLVHSPQAAADAEVSDEKNNLALILAGIEPPMREEGQNFQLRLQTLQNTVQANPLMPEIIKARPDRQAMLQARVKHLQFMVQQQQNADTGRTGAEPGLQEMQAQQASGQ